MGQFQRRTSCAFFLTLTILVVPYRILSHSEHERVVHRSDTCYLVGQAGNEALLFCPLQPPPRNRVVRLDDPDLERGGPEKVCSLESARPLTT